MCQGIACAGAAATNTAHTFECRAIRGAASWHPAQLSRDPILFNLLAVNRVGLSAQAAPWPRCRFDSNDDVLALGEVRLQAAEALGQPERRTAIAANLLSRLELRIRTAAQTSNGKV